MFRFLNLYVLPSTPLISYLYQTTPRITDLLRQIGLGRVDKCKGIYDRFDAALFERARSLQKEIEKKKQSKKNRTE